jgi:hypothetical protein
MRNIFFLCGFFSVLFWTQVAAAEDLPKLTTLSDPSIHYQVPEKPYVVLKSGPIEAVIADNRAVDDAVLPGHRAAYHGLASLKHVQRPDNLFVPFYAGLNLEHTHDGTNHPRDILFQPRNAPMELRVIDSVTAELYQKPTPTWQLETCLRYHMLEDGTIEMTMECTARGRTFANGYIGMFWASYIHEPESMDIHFRGHRAGQEAASQWIRGVTPSHGVDATHRASGDDRQFAHDADFALTLVFHDSPYRYSEPWYYGVSHGMAMVFMFRPKDQVRFSQSPSGAGKGNPAWDFQYFIADYQVGHRYQMVMRAMYVPYESPEQIERASRPHREALAR